MHTPGGTPEQRNIAYNPYELIEGLDLQSLHTLEARGTSRQLRGYWQEIVRDERLARERAVEALNTFVPAEVEMPSFDRRNTDEYLAQARATNIKKVAIVNRTKVVEQEDQSNTWADGYIDRFDVRQRLAAVVSAIPPTRKGELLTSFFQGNLYGVIGTAHAAALHAFQEARNAELERRFDGINVRNKAETRKSIAGMAITRGDITEAQKGLESIASTYEAPYPDFFQLRRHEQHAIVEALGREWEQLCLYIHSVDPSLLGKEASRLKTPLAYLPLRDLQEAVEAYPEISAKRLCTMFLNRPESFHSQIEHIREQNAQRTLETMARRAARAAAPPEAKPPMGPTDFMCYDHASVVVVGATTGKERRLYLTTNQANALLAARVLGQLARTRAGTAFYGDALDARVWTDMPVEERRLFTTNPYELKTQSGIVIRRFVRDTLRTLVSKLEITNKIGDQRYAIRQTPVVRLGLVPPSEEDLGALTPLFPPGTPREKVYEAAGDVIPPEALITAGKILQNHVLAGKPLSTSAAHGVLKFITDRNGQRALRAQMKAAGDNRHLNEVLDHLKERIAYRLGEGYEGALANCRIAGNTTTGKEHTVYVTGGRLPIITNTSRTGSITGGLDIITRWYAGDKPL